eukprot:g390.t1
MSEANLQNANLTGAILRNADLRGVKNLTPDMLQSTNGDLRGINVSGLDLEGWNWKVQKVAGMATRGLKASQTFTYETDFDKNGLLYCLGCCYANGSQWSNPHTAGAVNVTSSQWGRGDPVDIVGRTSTQCYSNSNENSFVCIDLKTVRIRLNKYTLRHGNNHADGRLQHWKVEGSNDGKEWHIIDQHENDPMPANFGSRSFDCNGEHFTRFIKLTQTDFDTSYWNFLFLSQMELYGMIQFIE